MTEHPPATNTDGDPPQRRHDRVVELASVVLLALAAVASAWSGYQSARWSGVQAIAFSEANAARLESTRASTRGGQLQAIDIGMFLQWAEAYSGGDTQLEQFLAERFRPPMKSAVDAWIATRPLMNADAPSSPFSMEQYALPELAAADELEAGAAAAVDRAKEANQRSDNYVLAVVLFASALFFAAVSTKLAMETARIAVVCVAWLVFVGTAAWVVTFPITVEL